MTRIHVHAVLETVVSVNHVADAVATYFMKTPFSLLLSVPGLVQASPLLLARVVCGADGTSPTSASITTMHSLTVVSVAEISGTYMYYSQLTLRLMKSYLP